MSSDQNREMGEAMLQNQEASKSHLSNWSLHIKAEENRRGKEVELNA